MVDNLMNMVEANHSERDLETNETETISLTDQIAVSNSEQGEQENVVLLGEAPVPVKDFEAGASSSGVNEKREFGVVKKLIEEEMIELGNVFQGAVSSHDWDLAESLILSAHPFTLDEALYFPLDAIWFFSTNQDLYGLTELIKKITSNHAFDFTRAVFRTSFLASCVSACQTLRISLADCVNLLPERLHEQLQVCRQSKCFKDISDVRFQEQSKWAGKCLGVVSSYLGNQDSRVVYKSAAEIQLQLSAFNTFSDLAGNNLTGNHFKKAFDIACLSHTLFCSSSGSGLAYGISTTPIHGLLHILVESGAADNVNKCFLYASAFGNTELVRILLQIAGRNGLDLDVDLALTLASRFCKIGSMECLVEEGNATDFSGCLMGAGCVWFVKSSNVTHRCSYSCNIYQSC